MYAILAHGGRQYRVSAGDRLVVDRLDAAVGSVVALEPVLLTGGDDTTALGDDVDGLRVAVTVVGHRRGEKLRIFKYKAKKRSRKVAGYRSDLTELRVESILAKGQALPKASATAAAAPAERPAEAAAPAARRPKPAAAKPAAAKRAAAKPAGKSAAAKPAAKPAAAKPAAKPAAAKPAAKRATPKRTGGAKGKTDGA